MKTHCVNGHPLTPDNIIFVNVGRGKLKRRCRTCIRERKQRYKEHNKGYFQQLGRKYSQTYYKGHKEIVQMAVDNYRRKQRLIVLEHYGTKCACCGDSHQEFLCVDHLNNNGTAHRKELESAGLTIYTWLIKNHFPEGFQLLCHNCNYAKHAYRVCPHQNSF